MAAIESSLRCPRSRLAWTAILVVIVALVSVSAVMAGVPKVIVCEHFGAHG